MNEYINESTPEAGAILVKLIEDIECCYEYPKMIRELIKYADDNAKKLTPINFQRIGFEIFKVYRHCIALRPGEFSIPNCMSIESRYGL